MSSALDFLDSTTKRVVEHIVEKYEKDIRAYSNNSYIQTSSIGISFIGLINEITHCIILSTETNSKCFGIKFSKTNNTKFNTVKESTNFHANNGFILQTQVLQIIDFLIRLKDEGAIMFTQIEMGKPIPKPPYNSLAPENMGKMFLTIQNKKINDFIDEIYYSNIVPTVSLIGFKNRDYKTIDQERFEATQCVSHLGIISAILIALFSPILMTHCSTSTINETQFDSLINIIQKSNGTLCDSIITTNSHNTWINYE